MKSIFFHFNIPVLQFIKENQFILDKLKEGNLILFKLENYLTHFFYIIYPPIFFKLAGYIVVIYLLILGLSYLNKKRLIKKTNSIIITNYIINHFKEVYYLYPSLRINKILKYDIYIKLSFLFITLLFINLGGMVYGSWCINTWFIATISFTLFIWILTLIFRIWNYIFLFIKNTTLLEGEEFFFLSGFIPFGTPLWLTPLMVCIEILSWIIRFLSMGLRIAGNLVAGHVILGIISFTYIQINKLILISLFNSSTIYSLLIQVIYISLNYFELAVAMIQAYVLTLLASTFLKETEELH